MRPRAGRWGTTYVSRMLLRAQDHDKKDKGHAHGVGKENDRANVVHRVTWSTCIRSDQRTNWTWPLSFSLT